MLATHSPWGEASGPLCTEFTPPHLCTAAALQHAVTGWQTPGLLEVHAI